MIKKHEVFKGLNRSSRSKGRSKTKSKRGKYKRTKKTKLRKVITEIKKLGFAESEIIEMLINIVK